MATRSKRIPQRGYYKRRTRNKIHQFKTHTRHAAYVKGRVSFYRWQSDRTLPKNPFRASVLRGDWTQGFLDAQTYYTGRNVDYDNKDIYNVKRLEEAFMDSIRGRDEYEPRATLVERIKTIYSEIVRTEKPETCPRCNSEQDIIEPGEEGDYFSPSVPDRHFYTCGHSVYQNETGGWTEVSPEFAHSCKKEEV